MNFQSIKNKTANLENMIQAVQPDIIIGNESWLHDNIQSSRYYQCYCHRRMQSLKVSYTVWLKKTDVSKIHIS
jgi:hypothetical protein